MRIATILDEADLCSEKQDERDRSVIAQTYIWWRLKVVPYRGRWNDMHQLAFAWRMSPTATVRRFRSVVCRISNAAICVSSFGTSWDSVLSEKV
jgi:hypothetical protein